MNLIGLSLHKKIPSSFFSQKITVFSSMFFSIQNSLQKFYVFSRIQLNLFQCRDDMQSFHQFSTSIVISWKFKTKLCTHISVRLCKLLNKHPRFSIELMSINLEIFSCEIFLFVLNFQQLYRSFKLSSFGNVCLCSERLLFDKSKNLRHCNVWNKCRLKSSMRLLFKRSQTSESVVAKIFSGSSLIWLFFRYLEQ